MPATPPVPELSGDGKFYWDGKRWVPIEQSEPTAIRSDSSLVLHPQVAALGTAISRLPRWLVALLPLIVGLVGWASGQLWLTWLAIPIAFFAVISVMWTAGDISSAPTTAPSASASPPESPRESSISACVGLAVADSVELAKLLRKLAPQGAVLGHAKRVKVVRWQDASGVRLVMETGGDDEPTLVPSFAARTRVHLRDVRMLNGDVAMATVVDERGQPLASMGILIEQRRLLPQKMALDGVGSIVPIGTEVSIHSNAQDFGSSDASLFLGPEDAERWRTHPDKPPANYIEQGWKWPRRKAAESFGSLAVFVEPAHAAAFAILSGTILTAERRTVVQTGQQILLAEIRTAGGFEVTVCLEGAAHSGLPPVGGVISGTVLMVASLETWHESGREA
jgi:hypothetical protein